MSVELLPTEQHRFYVHFELRPEEDRQASIEAGHPVFKDVEYASITPAGSGGKLSIDFKVDDALLNKWRHGTSREPASPYAISAYEAWKADKEIPVDGIDLRNWPGVTPAQLKMCHLAEVRTVEDLAEMSADTQKRLGMGALALKDKAIAYLKNATTNKASEEIAALKVKLEAMEAANAKKDEQIERLLAQMDEDKPKRGRPRKTDDD